jgi:hypothetical protein
VKQSITERTQHLIDTEVQPLLDNHELGLDRYVAAAERLSGILEYVNSRYRWYRFSNHADIQEATKLIMNKCNYISAVCGQITTMLLRQN